MESERMEKMTGILLAGGKMLSMHCPDCRSPLFKFKGKIICPNCGREAVKGDKTTEKFEEQVVGDKFSVDTSQIVQNKLKELGEKLEEETNPREISKILEAMKSSLEVLDRIGRGEKIEKKANT